MLSPCHISPSSIASVVVGATHHFEGRVDVVAVGGGQVGAAGEDDGHRGRTDLVEVGAEAAVGDTANGQREDAADVAVRAAVILLHASVTRRPHEYRALAAAPLYNTRSALVQHMPLYNTFPCTTHTPVQHTPLYNTHPCTTHAPVQHTPLYNTHPCTTHAPVQHTPLYNTRTCTTHAPVQRPIREAVCFTSVAGQAGKSLTHESLTFKGLELPLKITV